MPPQRRAAKPTPTKTKRAPRAKQPARKSTNSKTTVAIVGAGRVGTALAVALERSGYRINALVTRGRAHAQRSARLLRSRPLALGADALDEIPDSDILIFATPDDEIAATAARLAALRRTNTRTRTRNARSTQRVALHVSGARSSDALLALHTCGYAIGSLHPLVSVADALSGANDLRGAFYCIEGDAAAVRAARRIVRALGGQSFSVAARDKALYHAAAVFAAGHAVTLFDVATGLLTRCGVSTKIARRSLLTLSASALKNIERAPGNARAITGPFARRDLDTIRRHVAALDAQRLDEELHLYLSLGRRALRVTGGVTTVEGRRILDEIQRALSKLDESGAKITSDDS
jgi:predicted short-subunit dehydrogenase-like oxidoreductase (DUF2520 family)